MPTVEQERKLKLRLERLPNKLRVTFAAACAQRVLPNHAQYVSQIGRGDAHILAKILDELWNVIEGTSPLSQLEAYRDVYDTLATDFGDGGSEELEHADRAVASVAYAIRAQLSGDSQEAVWAATCASEVAESYADERLASGSSFAPLQAIFAHPVVRRECERQQRDLDELIEVSSNNAHEPAAIAKVRRRAQADSADFFAP